jgi:3-oxoacyl-[acyl-carrier protein] reductase
MTVKDRVALVTGGSRGIGRAIVEALARNGAKVAFVYNSNAAAAEEVVKALAAEGHEAWAIQADVRSKPAADQVVADVVAKWGKLEILVNNAGIIRDTLLAKMDSTQWQDVIDTNLTSVFQFLPGCHAADDVSAIWTHYQYVQRCSGRLQSWAGKLCRQQGRR